MFFMKVRTKCLGYRKLILTCKNHIPGLSETSSIPTIMMGISPNWNLEGA